MAKSSKKSGRRLVLFPNGARKTNMIVASVIAIGVALTGYSLIIGTAASPTASVTTTTTPAGKMDFQVGFDHTQLSHLASDAGGNNAAVQNAKKLLSDLDAPQNVHIMGFGAGNPEPSKGKYDWGSLDARVRVMGDTVGPSQRMITLCTAPGWMKGADDWAMEAAVLPEHFGDFAQLSAQVAQRYDGNHKDSSGNTLPKVVYFDVWNEMKGFWNDSKNRWDYEGYTNMYNQVYSAIKAVRPDAQIGGPYPSYGPSQYNQSNQVTGAWGSMDQRTLDVMTYWLQNKVGAEFISLDGGPQTNFETGAIATDGFTSGKMFAQMANWIRSLDNAKYPGAKTLPIRWAEFYPGTGGVTGQKAVAIDMDNAITAGLAGVSSVYIWEPEGDPNGGSKYTGYAVWTDVSRSGGGQPTPLYTALKVFHDTFPVGTQLYSVQVSGPVTALASADKVFLLSKSASILTVNVDGQSVTLSPYAVTTVNAHPANAGGDTGGGSGGAGGGTTTPVESTAGTIVGASGKCIDNSDNRQANRNKIQLWTCDDTQAQQWSVNSNGTITTPGGYCLDVQGARTANSTVVQLYTCNGTVAQKWVVNAATRTIVNPHSNKCLDARRNSSADGTQIQIYKCNGTGAQKWTVNGEVMASPSSDTSSGTPSGSTSIGSGSSSSVATGIGTLVGVASKCIDNNDNRQANGNKIQLWTCDSTPAQQWTINSNGTITTPGGYCLDAKDAGTSNGTLVQLWECDDTVAQQWTYDANAHTIVNPHSKLCLDDKYSGTADGNQIWLYACNGSNAQRWTFTSL